MKNRQPKWHSNSRVGSPHTKSWYSGENSINIVCIVSDEGEKEVEFSHLNSFPITMELPKPTSTSANNRLCFKRFITLHFTNFQASSDERTRKLPLILSRTHSCDTQAAIKLNKCNWRESVKMLFDERRSDAHQSCFHLPYSASEYENSLDVSALLNEIRWYLCRALPPSAKMEWKATKLKDMGKFTIQLNDHKFNWKSITRVFQWRWMEKGIFFQFCCSFLFRCHRKRAVHFHN